MIASKKHLGVLAAFVLLSMSACSSDQAGDETAAPAAPLEATAPSDQQTKATQTPPVAQVPQSAPAPVAVVATPPQAPKVLEPWEAWEYETIELPMGGFMKFAVLVSANTFDFDFPYGGPQRGSLTLREQNGEVETIVQIEKGQIQCHSFRPCQVLVRLNEEPAKQYEASGPSDNSSTAIFINSKTLPDQIAQAQRVRIQIPVFRQGEPVLEFNNPGLNKTLWLDNTVGKRR